VDVIGHQAVGENAYAMSRAILTHPLEIRTPVRVREENILSPITALRDMVGHAGENGSRKPGHLGRLSEEIIKVCVPFIREDYHRRQ
jgi:hypothetical protein